MGPDDELRRLFDLDPHALRSPYATYLRFRQSAPITWSDEFEQYIVTGHREILEILHDHQSFSSRAAGASPSAEAQIMRTARQILETDELRDLRARNQVSPPLASVLGSTDPPTHDVHRSLVNRAFTPRRVVAMEPGITAVADELIDGFAHRGQVEVVGHYAMPLASRVIGEALGVARPDLSRVTTNLEGLSRPQGNTHLTTEDFVAVLRAKLELTDLLSAALADRRASPLDDMMSRIAAPDSTGNQLTEDEQLAVVLQLLGAGVKTASKLLASSLELLLTRPDLAPVVDDPEVLSAFIEEVLRLESPVQGLYRTSTRPVRVGEVDIEAGRCLWLLYAAGNRDPEAFEAPDTLDLDRTTRTPHLAFGHGIHHCVGAGLARAEARIGLQRLCTRLTALELVAPSTVENSYILHGPKELRVRFAAA